MKIATTLADCRQFRASLPQPVGFVPTMGYLHDGHLSLVKRSKLECAGTIVSIFVNPTQFTPTEDLTTYPRNLSGDLEMLATAGVDMVWTPIPETVYPADFQTYITVEQISQPLEGAMRPGHFRGVATVVAKLFNVVQPQKAYFGQKDAQQLRLIQQMVQDLNFPVEIIPCPTHRQPDGLAMSSRNSYLNPTERQAATILYRALTAAQDAFAQGERDADQLRQLMAKIIHSEPLARLQYLSCANPLTLQELEGEISHALLSMAVYIGKTRLIDNCQL